MTRELGLVRVSVNATKVERNKKDEDKFASFCNVHKLFEELEKLKK